MSDISKNPYRINPITCRSETICKSKWVITASYNLLVPRVFDWADCLTENSYCVKPIQLELWWRCGSDIRQDELLLSPRSDLDLNPDWTFVDPLNRTQWESVSQHIFMRRNITCLSRSLRQFIVLTLHIVKGWHLEQPCLLKMMLDTTHLFFSKYILEMKPD